MSEIKIGDLVMVVRWRHKCRGQVLGMVFVVDGFDVGVRCPVCGEGIEERAASYRNDTKGVPVSWLKKIPPLDELEREKDKEELKA